MTRTCRNKITNERRDNIEEKTNKNKMKDKVCKNKIIIIITIIIIIIIIIVSPEPLDLRARQAVTRRRGVRQKITNDNNDK